FLADRHQAGHLRLGDGNLGPSKIGEPDVADDVVVFDDGSGGHVQFSCICWEAPPGLHAVTDFASAHSGFGGASKPAIGATPCRGEEHPSSPHFAPHPQPAPPCARPSAPPLPATSPSPSP